MAYVDAALKISDCPRNVIASYGPDSPLTAWVGLIRDQTAAALDATPLLSSSRATDRFQVSYDLTERVDLNGDDDLDRRAVLVEVHIEVGIDQDLIIGAYDPDSPVSTVFRSVIIAAIEGLDGDEDLQDLLAFNLGDEDAAERFSFDTFLHTPVPSRLGGRPVDD